MTRIILLAILLGFVILIPWGIITQIRRMRTQNQPPADLPDGVSPEWKALADRDARFREALEVRSRVLSLVSAQSDAPRYDDLRAEVDRLTERIAENLRVLEQTNTHLKAFDPDQIADREAELSHKLRRASDLDARRLLEASLRQLNRQRKLGDAIRLRSERLLSSVDHSVIQLQAVHLDLINVLSAGIQSDAGQVVAIKERIRDLAEELGMGAAENDEFAHLLLDAEVGESVEQEEVQVETAWRS